MQLRAARTHLIRSWPSAKIICLFSIMGAMHRKMNLHFITFLSPLALMLKVLDAREKQGYALERTGYSYSICFVDLQINPTGFLHLCTQCLPSDRLFL